jgi:hypothetical protein
MKQMRESTKPQRRSGAPSLFALLLLATACASGGGGEARVGSDPERITPEEVDEYRSQGVRDAEHLVQLARPRWLRIPSGARSVYGSQATTILVYRDGRYLGELDALSGLPLVGIRELRWLNAAEADVLPGAGNRHVHGAILIVTMG